jgi:hypothetical protein
MEAVSSMKVPPEVLLLIEYCFLPRSSACAAEAAISAYSMSFYSCALRKARSTAAVEQNNGSVIIGDLLTDNRTNLFEN